MTSHGPGDAGLGPSFGSSTRAMITLRVHSTGITTKESLQSTPTREDPVKVMSKVNSPLEAMKTPSAAGSPPLPVANTLT